jgi:hypothetical protein
MVATDEKRRYTPHLKPSSAIELNSWLSAAKEVLAGNEGRHGETHGGKRVKMCYLFVDRVNEREDGSTVDCEVE